MNKEFLNEAYYKEDSQSPYELVTIGDLVDKYKVIHTISTKTQLLKCPYCNQFLSFVRSEHKKPHFKHSRGEAEKNCKWRTHYFQFFPIKLYSDSVEFELGISSTFWKSIFNIKDSETFTIITSENKKIFEYKIPPYSDNLEKKDIDYFPVAKNISNSYIIAWTNNSKLYTKRISTKFCIDDINLFDYNSKILKPHHSNIEIDSKYWCVLKENCLKNDTKYLKSKDEFQYKEIILCNIKYATFCFTLTKKEDPSLPTLFSLLTQKYNTVDAAGSSLVLWPFCVFNQKSDRWYFYQKDNFWIYFNSLNQVDFNEDSLNKIFRLFPTKQIEKTIDNNELLKITCFDEHQFLLQTNDYYSLFSYKEIVVPSNSDIINNLKKKVQFFLDDYFTITSPDEILTKRLKNFYIKSEIKGYVKLISKDKQIEKIVDLLNDKQIPVNITKNTAELKVYIGRDCIYNFIYASEASNKSELTFDYSEDLILRKLNQYNYDKNKVPLPYFIKVNINTFSKFNKIQRWIKINRAGISIKSCNFLSKLIREKIEHEYK